MSEEKGALGGAIEWCGAFCNVGNLPASAHHAGYTATFCCCIPRRTAIFACASIMALLAWITLFTREFFHHYIRIFTGGYAFSSRIIIDFIDVTAAFFGLLGAYGCLELKVDYVRTFAYYLMVRWVACLGMYFVDIPILFDCESWRDDLQGAIKEYGWNPTMYSVAAQGLCRQELWLFLVFSVILAFFLLYLVYQTWEFVGELDTEPRYLLRAPKEIPSGAFRAVSTGVANPQREAWLRSHKVPAQLMDPYGAMGVGAMPGGGPMRWDGLDAPRPMVGPPIGVPGPYRPGLHFTPDTTRL